MHRRDGMKQEEIAQQLGISYHTVKEYMKKALASIRTYAANRLDVLIFIALQTFLHD
jgi:DNA-directed RNA polymerase specialized sigma24 family protein